jgi:hypothetical protein
MARENRFYFVESESLNWPSSIPIPHGRFRLFVAADVTRTSTELISEFAYAALTSGMVYFCAWGQDCERFHDIVDELVVEDEIGAHLFAGAAAGDTIMTALGEALDFFINLAEPTSGLDRNSDYWVAVSVNNSEWAAEIRRRLEAAHFRT